MKNTKIAQMRKRLEESKQSVYNLTHEAEQKEFDRLERTHQMGQVRNRRGSSVSMELTVVIQVRMALGNSFARCVDRTTLASKKGKMQGVKDAEVHSHICCANLNLCAISYNWSSSESSAVTSLQSMTLIRKREWISSAKRFLSVVPLRCLSPCLRRKRKKSMTE